MSMTEEQQKGLTRLLERLGSALLGLKGSVENLDKRFEDGLGKILSQGSAQLTEFALLKQAIQEARTDVADAEKAVDELRRDLTPVHGVPLLPRREHDDDSIELGPAKVPARFVERVGRNLPWIVAGAIVALTLLVFAVYASGARLVVEEKRSQPRHDEQQQQHHEQGDHQ